MKIVSIDIETACAVEGCKHFGRALCDEKHSLSPWHSRITAVAAVGIGTTHLAQVYRGPNMITELQDLVATLPSDVGIVGQNFKFDWLHLAVRGLEIPLDRWVGDSQLAAFVLTDKIPDSWLEDYNFEREQRGGHHRKGSKHSLKTLAPYFLGVERFWEPADGNLDNDEYVLKDAEYTARLVVELERRLKDLGQYDFYKSRLLPWSKMLVTAELRGVKLDLDYMAELEQKYTDLQAPLLARLNEMWAPAHEAYKELRRKKVMAKYAAQKYHNARWAANRQRALESVTGIDYDSSKQMLWLLRDFMGYDCTITEWSPSLRQEVTKDTTGKKVLTRLADEGREDVATYLEWRQNNKILTSYFPSYKALQHEGVLHPIFIPTKTEKMQSDSGEKGTRTGRLSSERPNAQQVPESLRPLVVARPGYSFIGYDQAAIEARLIALYTEDPTLFEIVTSGKSIHDLNVKVFFDLDTPIEEVKKAHPIERAAAKNVGFALFYHAGAGRIRGALSEKGYQFSKEHCTRILYRFRDTYPTAFEAAKGVVDWMEQGNVLVNLLGRPLKIEKPEDAYMKAFNTLIQSSASDLLLDGAYQAWQQMKAAGIEAHPTLFVHDFVQFEVKDEHVAEANALISKALTGYKLENRHGQVPLEVEGGVSKRWEK